VKIKIRPERNRLSSPTSVCNQQIYIIMNQILQL
jgi:hypothetical protein